MPACKRQKLRDLRISKGMTQADLGQILGASEVSVRNWEGGRSIPSPRHVPDYAKLLGLDPMQLIAYLRETTAAKEPVA